MRSFLNDDELLDLFASVTAVSNVPPLTAESLVMWREVLGEMSYEEGSSAVIALARNLENRRAIGPGDIFRVVRERRERYGDAHPSSRDTSSLTWNHKRGRYEAREASDAAAGN